MAKPHFQWDDALLLDEQLTDEERMIRDAARDYCQGKLLPRVLEANRHGHPEPAELCNLAMFELLYSSGLRVSELAGLDLAYRSEKDSADGASLGWFDAAAGEVVVTGKGGKMRRVPVGGPAREVVRVWLIAISLLQRGHGRCEYASIRLVTNERTLEVL